MEKTKKPKGVKITRSGNNVYAEWECASENYSAGQELQLYRVRYEMRRSGTRFIQVPIVDWKSISIGNSTRKKKIATVTEWINNRAQSIRVRGKRAPYTTGSGSKRVTHTPDWSDWVQASISFDAPNVPSVSIAQGVSDATCTMSWNVSGVDSSNTKPFSHIEYQTMIIENKSNSSFPESLWTNSQKGWGTGTRSSASGSLTINNNVTFTSDNTFTRVVRARAIGPAGESAWSTPKYYTYATPMLTEIEKGTAVGTASYRCDVSWKSPATFAHPIDYFHPMYLMGNPSNTSMGVPAGAVWSEAGPNQANHQKAYPFALSNVLGYDEALWFRIDALHGTRERFGRAYFVKFGGVKPITTADIYIEYDSETRALTVGETYASDLPNPSVKVEIPYYNNNGQVSKTVAYKVDGELELNNYVLPTNVSTVIFRARVEWGGYSTDYISKEFNPKTAASPYAYCPTSINISDGSVAGSVNMSWNVPLGDATGAEIGYSTNQVDWTTEDAINDDHTVVTNIDYDVDYWYRVRLKSSRGETKWSESVKYRLSTSSLATPDSLTVTQGDMKDNLRVTWDWDDFPTANGIEISWANNPNAWDSSEPPSSAQIDRTESNGTFYISGLERDVTWYVRARFVAANAFSGAITKSYELPMVTVAPSNVTFERTSRLNTPRISWDWSWDDAESAEISWANDTGAWTATSGLESTTIEDRTRDYLDIAELETGKIWYAKVKLIYDRYSSESDIVSVDLRTNPITPVITLSDTTIPAGIGKTDISWTYACEDGLPQKSAAVWVLDANGNLDHQLAGVEGESTSVTIYAESYGLEGNVDYSVVVQTTSESGFSSEWSVPAILSVITLPEAQITESSIVTETVGENPQTYTGDIVQIDNSEEITSVESLSVSLEPIQDLHGYDKPWSGGAGKNKINVVDISTSTNFYYVQFGTDYELTADQTYTFSADVTSNIEPFTLSVGSGTDAYAVDILSKQNNNNGRVFITFTPTSAQLATHKKLYVRVPRYVTPQSITATIKNIQLEFGSTASSYEPYSNICPISGRTECVTYVSGHNLFSGEYDVMYKLPQPIPKDTYVTASAKGATRIVYYDENQNQIDYWSVQEQDPNDSTRRYRTFCVSQYGTEDAYYIKFTLTEATDLQFEIVDSASSLPSPYEAPTTYTTDLGRTVYGGTLEQVGGSLTDKMVLIDLGSLIWISEDSAVQGQFRATYGDNPIFRSDTPDYYGSAVCSAYPFGGIKAWNTLDDKSVAFSNGEGTAFMLRLKDTTYTGMSAADFKTAMSGVQLCYELATPQTYQLTSTEVALLKQNNIWSDDGEITVDTLDNVRQGNFLKALPLTLSATGVGDKGTITAFVERTRPYFVEQPDEKPTRGHEGEIVLLGDRNGDGSFSFDIDDLKGSLDDGGLYRLTVLVKDSMGQTDDDYIDFEVMWEHKASMPEATVVTEDGVVKITPTVPEEVWEGDYCEIYRLSADTPQLIVPHAEFGETYVDPFPTLGQFGGHRIVYRTTCGDFVTADKIIAWRDYEAVDDAEFPEVGIMEKKTIIDFGTGRVELDRNLDVDNKWTKDFVKTSYLGGSIQGDWNPAVDRDGSVSTCLITLTDADKIKDMRRLAVFTGECHVRTPDGSSYAADIQVSESWSHDKGYLISDFSLDIARVDGERYDGMTLDEWEADND